jgi:F-type H+-transporting ATPase subunit delta
MDKNLHLKLGKAVYDRALQDQNSKEVFDNLQSLNDLFKDLNVVRLFNNLAYADSDLIRKTVRESFDHPLENTVFELLVLLIQNHNVQLLPKIFAGFRRHRFEMLGIREVKIRTARVLSQDEKVAISNKMGFKTGKLHITFQQQADLIGGMQIYDQGRLTDLSVRNYLNHLKTHLHNLES